MSDCNGVARHQELRPVDIARLRAERMGLDRHDTIKFMQFFDFIRDAELRHQDTYKLWREYVQHPEGSVAMAAYIEAVASTRKMAAHR